MCGIACYIGKKRKANFLVSVLKKLEYRGYDSAGIAIVDDEKIKVLKKSGSISNLENSLPQNMFITTAIAHTRWATHGEANETNAHPHLSSKGGVAVVHNGIIENYKILKKQYNLNPESETDTAVVSELLEKNNVQTIFEFIDVISMLDGSYALSAIFKGQNNLMFLAKEKSPLYVSKTSSGEILVASDPICFSGFSKEYYSFNDGEFAVVENKEIIFFNNQKRIISKKVIKLDDRFDNPTKDNFEHFMLKEIYEEPDSIKRMVNAYLNDNIFEKFSPTFLEQFDEVKFIGCGTAYHAGLMGAKYVQKILNKKASAEIASEFIYFQPNFINNKTLFVFVSQSGETADTLRALEIVKNNNSKSIALTNVLYSSLAKNVDYVLPIMAGVEIAVASTKAYVNMLAVIYLLSSYFAGEQYYKSAKQKLLTLADEILQFDKLKIQNFAKQLKQKKEAIFIGKDMDYITALEASLKLKEIAYINASVYPSGELKHGFLALVEKGVPLLCFACQKEINQKTMSSASEAKSRGAEIFMFSNGDMAQDNDASSDDKNSVKNKMFIDAEDELLLQIKMIAPLQYLAYLVSTSKNINPDQPRNLAKSVTVE